jgi:hypothetical protein
MTFQILLITLFILALQTNANANVNDFNNSVQKNLLSAENVTFFHKPIELEGQWLKEENGQGMINPQTSGLTFWRGQLITLSDASANSSQQKQFHIVDAKSAEVSANAITIELSARVAASCFAEYLSAKPDLEAITIDPHNDHVFIVATEDASRGKPLTPACQKRFSNSGSTIYPSLLLRIELINPQKAIITHVRPIQFAESDQVGNFPNDGIEGLAFGKKNILYLALESDKKQQARIFSLHINKNFWLSSGFAPVIDAKLFLPKFINQKHPINGMDYLSKSNHPGYLVAAARNDDQLWLIDLAKQQPTKLLNLNFMAPTQVINQNCKKWEPMTSTSLEGIAVSDEQIWMINDPWQKHYSDNIRCNSNRKNFENLVPLLFTIPISDKWFQ